VRAAVRLATAIALAVAVPAGAQESADKARLDEFALPVDEAGRPIEQLGHDGERLPAAQVQANDRQLAVPGPPMEARLPMAQLSPPDDDGVTRQVNDKSDSRELRTASVSTSRDSRPQASIPLAGHDRCDAQLASEQLERCLHILEVRASEFSAPEAPQMSAEQALLAERGNSEERMASTSSDLRLRLASVDPNAEFASNQELASIYLDRSPSAPAAASEQQPVEEDDGLAAVLQSLQIEVPGSGE